MSIDSTAWGPNEVRPAVGFEYRAVMGQYHPAANVLCWIFCCTPSPQKSNVRIVVSCCILFLEVDFSGWAYIFLSHRRSTLRGDKMIQTLANGRGLGWLDGEYVHSSCDALEILEAVLAILQPVAGYSVESQEIYIYISGWWFGCHFFIFPLILGMSSSQLTFIFFRGVAEPPTRYIYIYTFRIFRDGPPQTDLRIQMCPLFFLHRWTSI